MFVAARPSIGKSMFVLHLAIKNCLNKIPCFYISLEMSPAQTKSRILSWVKNGDVDKEDIPELEATETFKIIDEYFFMEDEQSSNGALILSSIDSFFREFPNGIAIVDTINLARFYGEDEWASLRHMSRALKELCRKRESIVIACAQASRDADKLGISMDTLYGASTLEQDSDIIIGLEAGSKDSIKIPIVKNRDNIKDIDINAKINKATMHFYDAYSYNG